MKKDHIGQEYIEFGKKLRQHRQARGLTQGQLAEVMNISKTSVVNYETATRKIPLALIKRFSEFFHISMDELIGIENVPEVHPILMEHWNVYLCKLGLTDNEAEELCAYAEFIIHRRKQQ